MSTPETGATERSVVHLRDYGRVLSERRNVVIACLVLVVSFTALFTFLAHPVYRATTTIQIERKTPDSLNFGDTTSSDFYDYNDFYQTQYKVLQSKTVLKLAAERLDLPNRPEYASRKGSPLGRLVAWGMDLVSGTSAEDRAAASDPWRRAVSFMETRLTVEPVRNSKLVKLTFQDIDKNLCADAANAVADAYEQFNTDTRFTSSSQAREFLTKQVARLQSEIAAEERQLQDYSTKKEILALSDGTQDISQKALGDMNGKLVEAKGRLALAQARYDAVASGAADSLPEVLASPLIVELKKQNAEIERQHSQMSERFKPDWPPLQQLQEELDGARDRLQLETDAIARQVRSVAKADLQKTRDEVVNLDRQVTVQKGEVQRVGRDAIEYSGLKAGIETKRKILADLLTRQNDTETTNALKDKNSGSNMRIVDHAEVPRAPFKPNKPLNLFLSLVFGLGLGAAAALLLNYLDNTVKNEQDIQRHAGVPALGFIPLYQPLHVVGPEESTANSQYAADMACHADPRSSFAEAFKSLRTAFLLAAPERAPRRVVVTSCEPLDGKSTVITNLAIALTQLGRAVVIVDADLRRPRVHKVFGIENGAGLSSFLSGNAEADEIVRESGIPGLHVVTSGPVPPNPSELLASKALESFMEKLDAQGPFDHIFFDSPPLLQMADAVLLANRMDATILVAREGRTVHQALASGVKRLRQSRAMILGAVLNAVVERFGNYYYYRYHRDEPAERRSIATVARVRRGRKRA
ncbi:MAG TPA: polysaccharide biosynthesis tyrosine autokinase [Candidatus Polarisedimenticolaceae bacterium]|nr:polysaccharide biosynthesis tyrosine autokinase [Candidatus Polarisedimenticolaceae bacterium]